MNKKRNKISAIVMLVCLLFQTFWPTVAFALTSGPAQPEAASFEPVGTSEMVDNFTGDFSYNIPLMDVEGYPLNISYHSGIGMDQEATWTGLGWNVNVGAITRNMRGLPDDFDGDMVRKQLNMAPNETYGVNIGVGAEVFGIDAITLNYSLGVSYNNYTGYGVTQGLGISISPDGFPGTLGLGLNSGPDGLTVSPHVSFSAKLSDGDEPTQASVTVGTSINSRSGMKKLTLDVQVSQQTRGTKEKATAADKKKNPQNYPKSKQNKSGTSQSLGGTGTSISFGAATYVPQLTMPMKNYSFNFSAKIGGTVFGVDASANIGGSYSRQGLAIKEDYVPAFGYLNIQDGQPRDKTLLDFNREKDGSFSENTPDLPLTNFSYDIYSATGQGMGATFRPYRSDLGYVFDSRVDVTSDDLSLSGELSFGELLQAGLDISVTQVSGTSGKWTDNNLAASQLNFTGPNTGIIGNLYEPAYFKETGEKNVDTDPLFDNIGGTTAVRVDLLNTGDFEVPTGTTLINENTGLIKVIPNQNYRTTGGRAKRNQLFSYISKGEYNKSALNRDSLNAWVFQWNPTTQSAMTSSGIPLSSSTTFSTFISSTNYSSTSNNKHLAEITATKTDGIRYVYGLPLYNIYQKEASFNVSGRTADPINGFVTYNPATNDNTNTNTTGTDNFYTGTELPPFVHSYLLTDVLSADYVDVLQDGPTDDDLGSYTKFIYATKTSATTVTPPTYYQWRTPFTSTPNQATYDPGLHTVGDDERGSYIYGVKEVRFLQKIETKNYVAIFDLGDRKDGYGVSDENGSGLGATLKYLKTITLYSKPDYKLNGSNAFIIKQVHFVYNYDLCQGIPNNNKAIGATFTPNDNELTNNGGKLTLQKIYFTYGGSYKAQLSPYQFTYNTSITDPITHAVTNPVLYDIKAYDRWGNYKPNPGYSEYCASDGLPNTSPPTAPCPERINAGQKPLNQDFTYVNQDPAYTNQYVQLWNLSQIQLPSGGTINVNYESDDYAYVQDQPATQMMMVSGEGTSPNDISSSSNSLIEDTHHNYYLYFKLQNSIPASTANPQGVFKDSYIKNMSQLYFRFYTNVNGSQGTSPFFATGYEYVSGYAGIDSYGAIASSGTGGAYDYGYIKLTSVDGGDHVGGLCCGDQENPISKATWQFARIHTPRQAYNGANVGGSGNQTSFIQALCNASLIGGIINFFQGANGQLKNSLNFGKTFDPSRSWIRLYSPTGKKLGGGSRVTSVTINDQWSNMVSSGPGSFTYGQVYNYTTVDPANNNTISSGVASYEPSYGADENVMRQPLWFGTKPEALLAPDNSNYMETPLGETFFPSPTVGYSKVTVQNLPRYVTPNVPSSGLLVNSNATGSVVYEFYTSRDFPVILNQTNLAAFRKKSNPLASLVHLDVKDYMTASEGYCIELNDMAGKPKSQMVYAQGQSVPISGVKHFYKQNGNQLVNTCTTVSKNGNVTSSQLGLDYDFISDFREQLNNTNSFSLQGNMHFEMVGPDPLFEITIIPNSSAQSSRFRSAVVTKVINHYGVEESTEVFDLSSRIATKNLAWDAETGDILLTQTTTEFNDNTYTLNYPAYWGYGLMGGAYANIDATIPGAISSIGNISYPNIAPGDEIEILDASGNAVAKAWVYNNFGTNIVIDKNGNVVTSSTYGASTVKVIRSGRRNMQASYMGKLVTFNNPIWTGASPPAPTTTLSLPALDTSFHILSASSVVYDNKWNIFCECGITANQQGNPYLLGLLGNWREKVAYTYLTLRSQSTVNENTNIRKDGAFLSFSPFWTPNSGSNWNINTTNWQFTSQVTQYSPHGFEIENVDPLLRYSSALYGYNYALPIGVSSNAKYTETAFDGFEDYDFNACTDDHFGWKAKVLNATKQTTNNTYPLNTYQNFSHTGRRSVLVTAGTSTVITKVLNACSSAPTVVTGTISGGH
jgi:hypothetical protein